MFIYIYVYISIYTPSLFWYFPAVLSDCFLTHMSTFSRTVEDTHRVPTTHQKCTKGKSRTFLIPHPTIPSVKPLTCKACFLSRISGADGDYADEARLKLRRSSVLCHQLNSELNEFFLMHFSEKSLFRFKRCLQNHWSSPVTHIHIIYSRWNSLSIYSILNNIVRSTVQHLKIRLNLLIS